MEYIIRQTETFATWRSALKDLVAKTAIRRRIERAEAGNMGDAKPVGEGVSEMRIDVGAGYRVYFTIRNQKFVFLLAGGNKSTQTTDIRNAIAMAKEL
jgi:putative addiction module killer protein